MIAIPEKAKEPLKIALSVVIAYGIALQMDWDNPYWAGFAVAFCSLSTVGQSFNKAAMRMFGTLVAAFFALTLIALFPQDRWLFMLALSIYVGFCTYMMGGAKRQYFWNVCGFVCVIICMGAGADPVNAFQTAVVRSKETGLGILVFSLMSMLLWPTSSRSGFFAAISSLATGQRQLFHSCLSEIEGGEGGDVAKLRGQVLQAQAQSKQLLDAAETDTYEIWELRKQWQHHQENAVSMTETIGRWRESFSETQTLTVSKLFANLDLFIDELDTRFAQIELMLAGQGSEREPIAISLNINKTGVEGLSHFDRASLIVFRSRLLELEQLTRIQFETVRGLKGFGADAVPPESYTLSASSSLPDPDRWLGVFRVILTMWLAYLLLIYVDSVPGGSGFVTMTTVFAMISASMPHFPLRKMYLPIALSVAFGSLVYLFIMPHLSSFFDLGLLLFTLTFAFCYLFDAPQQALAKAFGLAMFMTIASVNNQQTYSFMVVATNVLMWPLMFMLMAFAAHFPWVMRPEKSFLRLLGRYFRSYDYLLADMNRDPQQSATGLEQWRQSFHLREMSTIPSKLGVWSKFIDFKPLVGTSPVQVQSVVTSLEELSGRFRELIEERNAVKNHFLAGELSEDARAWRQILQGGLGRLRSIPTDQDVATLRASLNEIMKKLETRIKETLDQGVEGKVSAREGENFYRLLGAYRSVSDALIGCAVNAGTIDWVRWREERF